MQSRYYNPEIGRFINADAYASTDQGLLGNNMFAYCHNNPINYVDPTGELLYPGEIHNQVVKHIADKYGLAKEQSILYGFCSWGRADLISDDGQVWDVKRDKPWHLVAGEKQVIKYTEGIWAKNPEIPLTVGTAPIKSGMFSYTSGLTTYTVTYRDAGNGVIAYDYVVSDYDTQTANQIATTAIVAIVFVALAYLGIPVFA